MDLCQAVCWLVLALEFEVGFESVWFTSSFSLASSFSCFLFMVHHQSVRRQSILQKHIGSLCLCHVILRTIHWPKPIAWSNLTLMVQGNILHVRRKKNQKTIKLHGKGHDYIILIQGQHEESSGMVQSTILY